MTTRTRSHSRRYATVLITAACISSGCSDGRESFAPVSGRVFIDGEPLTFGVVKFAPKGGRQSMGAIQGDGTFTLGSYQGSDGAIVGEHRVAVVAREQISDTVARWHAPKKYANYNTSGLTSIVTEPTDSITIHLTWGGMKGPMVEHD